MKIKGLRLKASEREALLTLKNILSTKFNLLDFLIFGSKVRGDATHESDIDLMIELDEISPHIKSQIHDIVFKVNLEYDTFISTTIFSKKEIEEGPMSESPIYKTIKREGVSV